MEVCGQCDATPVIVHRVLRELVRPNARLFVFLLVIIGHKLTLAVTVKISHSDAVGAQDLCIIDSLCLHERAVLRGNSEHANSFVKEVSDVDDDFIGVLFHGIHKEANICKVTNQVLCP